MNILITGANGQLGKCFAEHKKSFNDNLILKDKTDLDILDYKNLRNTIIENNIKLIINCASYTNVDQAEINKETCFNINVIGLENILRASTDLNIFLIHFSSDYVFDGEGKVPLTEKDLTNPINYYGYTKLISEKLCLKSSANVIIFRVSWLYSKFKNNFLTKVIDLFQSNREIKFVDDQISSPTNAEILVKDIIHIINKKTIFQISDREIFHYSDSGFCSKFEFVIELAKKLNISTNDFTKISTRDFKSLAQRPKFSVLEQLKFRKFFKIDIKSWDFNLINYKI